MITGRTGKAGMANPSASKRGSSWADVDGPDVRARLRRSASSVVRGAGVPAAESDSI